ncbi:hypothetical protein GGR88_000639 [Sphingomonas jejuensis]|uniref:Thioredoxin domain-containing protein n=1 Tax=Sphingomonas jejuensis TaxID=904715 RepID=A0ABX0XIV0_9SPHN|nr:hypothetical protein [Sphingomonas jejuensis]
MRRTRAILAAALIALVPAGASARVVEATWTDAAKRVFVQRNAKGQSFQLPEVRAFDAEGRPILRLMPAGTSTVGQLRQAAAGGRVIAGATLDDVLSAFELRDGGGPVRPAVGTPSLVVVDFWAEWCVPCKAVSHDLDRWLATQPEGSVTLIRAETDFMAAARGQ